MGTDSDAEEKEEREEREHTRTKLRPRRRKRKNETERTQDLGKALLRRERGYTIAQLTDGAQNRATPAHKGRRRKQRTQEHTATRNRRQANPERRRVTCTEAETRTDRLNTREERTTRQRDSRGPKGRGQRSAPPQSSTDRSTAHR